MATIVNISGTGDANYCYAQVNGTKYTKAASNITLNSSTIVFEVYGNGSSYLGKVTIDGDTVLTSDTGNATYSWTVPNSVTEINIVLTDQNYYTTVTVTTQKSGDSGDGGGEHYTNIGGTAREIESGTVLIGGVLREIESGLVLVNGVAREIAFKVEPRTFNVTISGSTQPTRAKVEINGVEYSSAARLVVESGTELIAYAMSSANGRYTTQVNLNGTRVLTSSSGSWFDTYTHVIESDVEVELNSGNTMTINITTS